MELDEDLIYAILKWRKGVQKSGGIAPPDLLDWRRNQVCYHVELCYERGLIRSYSGTKSDDGQDPEILECRIGPLAFAGHVELKRLSTARR